MGRKLFAPRSGGRDKRKNATLVIVVVIETAGSKSNEREKSKKYKRKKNGEPTPPVVLTITNIIAVKITASSSLPPVLSLLAIKRMIKRRAVS